MNFAHAAFFRRTAVAVLLATAAQSMGLPLMAGAQAQSVAADTQASGQPVAVPPPGVPMSLPADSGQGVTGPAQASQQPLQVPRAPPGVPMRVPSTQPYIPPGQPQSYTTGPQQVMSAPQSGAPQYATSQSPPAGQAMPIQPGQRQTGQPQGPYLSLPELQALVAPVALYPDSLLAQMMIAATYPLDVAAATLWLQNPKNGTLTGSALEAALQQQSWDNSVKSLVAFPDALRMLGNKLEWTQKLGDAYLAQPGELMQAVQALRTQARNAGHLQSGSQMTVTTDAQSNIIIQPTNPQVVYVPTYNPYMVYGPWGYPAYPPWPVYNPGWGYLAFGAGVGAGAALWATPYWGRGYVYVNHGYYNRFNAAYNAPFYRGAARPGPGGPWVYNPAHRGNVPYSNAALRGRYAVTPAQRQQFNQARAAAQNYWNHHPGARPTGAGARAPAARPAGAGHGASSPGAPRPSGGGGGGHK
jgi:hypothetical protein